MQHRSPGMNGLDPWARLLFIAMWNWADDFGRGTASPKELGGFAFPHDEDITATDIRRWLGEIRRAFDVVFYEVDGRPYYYIPSWEKHQKIDKRSQPKYPAPEEGRPWDPEPVKTKEPGPELLKLQLSESIAGSSAEPAESSADAAEVSALEIGTGEQGNRGSTSVPAVGGLTDRNARAYAKAPPAQPEDFLARKVIHDIPRYANAPGWVRRHLVPLVAAAMRAGFGAQAISGYAVMVMSEGRYRDDQHIPELRGALSRLSRDATLGTACRACGLDPGDCPCRATPAADRPWTEQDQADFEAALAHLGVTADELDRGA
ncbi:hypothetical protein [Sphaerisporangium siamense]|uniref:Uncharacterized protein n=1 Tax=Sphaerisporangium siamense TaxID=795645 RepID=A0A7W7DBW2_9ACTN|nr:hypothetical protein [Sphaerisporangium siamense]MBB4702528.1 hypothetical protein [Sphaerisporangium siamense]